MIKKIYIFLVSLLFVSLLGAKAQNLPIIDYSSVTHPEIGSGGMVVSQRKIASEVGAEILREGGNAVDAAVATALALAVVLPRAGNLGGGGFMLVYSEELKKTIAIDYREMAPFQASRDMFLDKKGNYDRRKAQFSLLSAGVPGTVAGLGYAHEKYGIKSWNYLLRPAIKLASSGFELSYRDAMYLNASRLFFLRDEEAAKIFASKEPYQLGDLFIQRDLGKTLRRISVAGYQEFYTGITANMIQECMDRTGGIITRGDLRQYRPIEREPIEFKYRDFTFYSMPPASSGGICLSEILNQPH